MSISLGQILIIILVGLLLFGNFPNILRDIIRSIKSILSSISEKDEKPTKVEQKKIQEKGDSNPQPTVLETVVLPIELFSSYSI